MSAHVLLNLLNQLGKKIRCEAVPRILSVFPNEILFIIWHLNYIVLANFALKCHDFAIRKKNNIFMDCCDV